MIKLIPKKGKYTPSPKFESLEMGDTFRMAEKFAYDKDNIYMKTWDGFACIIGKNTGSTWTGSYDGYKIDEVKLEATEV